MSVINKKKKFIFIHVPKTAGTSMEDSGYLGAVLTRHYGIDHYNEEVDIDKYFKFAFVRNPFDRLRSAICQHGKLKIKDNKTFNGFIQKHSNMVGQWIATKPQYTFLCINGLLRMDFVGRFEHLKRDWESVCRRLKINETFTLPHSKKGDYPKDLTYTPENVALVQKIYKRDFELFGYETKSFLRDL